MRIVTLNKEDIYKGALILKVCGAAGQERASDGTGNRPWQLLLNCLKMPAFRFRVTTLTGLL